MPKLRLSATEKADLEFKALLESARIRERLDNEKIAKMIGISMPTLCKRKTDPGSMTLAELRRYVRLFKLTPRDVCAVVGVEEGGIK